MRELAAVAERIDTSGWSALTGECRPSAPTSRSKRRSPPRSNRTFVLVDRGHGVAEDHLRSQSGTLEDHSRELAARDAHETIPQCATDRHFDLRTGEPGGVDEAKPIDEVTAFANAGEQPHPLSDVESASPEIEHVTARSELRCVFDDGWLEAGLRKPVGEGRASDT